jgi:hypothetical protein
VSNRYDLETRKGRPRQARARSPAGARQKQVAQTPEELAQVMKKHVTSGRFVEALDVDGRLRIEGRAREMPSSGRTWQEHLLDDDPF